MGVVALLTPSNRWRPWLLPLTGLAHLVLVAVALWSVDGPITAFDNWLVLDDVGKLVLGLISVLFFLCAAYAPGYLALRPELSNRVLCTCLLLSLGVMSLVALSHH